MIWCLLSLALGCFIKYTVMFFALPFVVYFGIHILSQYGLWSGVAVASGLFGLMFGSFFARNYSFFGSILGPLPGSRFYTGKIPADGFSLAYSVSNTIKNAGLHMGLPYLPYNHWVDSVIDGIHRLIGVSVYFQTDKLQSILSQDRAQTYFTNYPGQYTDYVPLLAHIGPNVQNIGILFTNDWGIYHFWSTWPASGISRLR